MNEFIQKCKDIVMDNEIEINTKEGIYKVNGIDISMSNKIVVILDLCENERIVRVEWD